MVRYTSAAGNPINTILVGLGGDASGEIHHNRDHLNLLIYPITRNGRPDYNSIIKTAANAMAATAPRMTDTTRFTSSGSMPSPRIPASMGCMSL